MNYVMPAAPSGTAPQRKLSPWRVLLTITTLLVVIAAGVYGSHWQRNQQSTEQHTPWFASYVDVTATPTYPFEQTEGIPSKQFVLSFIVASPENACTPSWGGAYTIDEASTALDLDRRIARLRQQGGDTAISFGGLHNQELAVACTNQEELTKAYQTIIDHYAVDTIDLDLEGSGLTDTVAGERRAVAIATLQRQQRAQGKNLAVWVTLPVTPQGLTKEGTDTIAQMLRNDIDIAGINIMTMNYGTSRADDDTMFDNSKNALTQTHRQLGVLYQRAGIHLNSASLWAKLGATPMIGQNDTANEVFTLQDASQLNNFAISRGAGRLSMWSANRDIACGSNYANTHIVSDSCSGIPQKKYEFGQLLSRDLTGTISASSRATTQPDTKVAQQPDDPAKSPYPIWSEDNVYTQGTKVVWRHNVYQAKWWTRGDTPDNPVLQAWETPWKLIGPVLPGEKPAPRLALPSGTYPEWTNTTTYRAGERVLFEGVPYQAKWWTQGDFPGATSHLQVDNSPWTPLTSAQISEVLRDFSDKAYKQ